MLIAKVTTKTTQEINKSQGQVIGDVSFGKLYQIKLTYQLRYNQILM